MRAAFYTLGCKVNQYETAVLQQQFAAAGYDIVEPEADAEVYVVNSCTVTATGDKKSRQVLRRFKRRNPAAVVCLTGCFPQAFPNIAEAIPEADVITGSKNRAGLLAAVSRCLQEGGRVIDINPHRRGEAFEGMAVDAMGAGSPLPTGGITRHVQAGDAGGQGHAHGLPLSGGHHPQARTRAFVKIEDGCDRYCAYCIIPTARGPVRSKPPAELQSELTALARNGHREVVLVGINLSSYGRDLGCGLLDALRLACGTPGIDRVRLGSLEPELLTDGDIAAMGTLPGLCPQFHLSLQSGCDETLRRMGRHYDTAEYLRIAGRLRQVFPGCAITTDIMVGFPGETDDEFAASLAFAQRAAFAKAHVFAYSPRPGTRAADMPDQIPADVKARRAAEMAAVTDETRAAFLESQVGRTAVVLAETQTAPGRWQGYSENYTPVVFHNGGQIGGKLRVVRLEGVSRLDGELCMAGEDLGAPPQTLPAF